MIDWTEARMFAAIYRTYGPIGANTANVCLRHIPAYVDTPIGTRGYTKTTRRYIDALVMRSPLKPVLWAVEIKVTKADLNIELKDLPKSETWRKHTHAFYLAVPPDLVEYAKSVVPPEWGIMSALHTPTRKREKVSVVRRAKQNKNPEPLESRTWWAMARRAGKNDYKECSS